MLEGVGEVRKSVEVVCMSRPLLDEAPALPDAERPLGGRPPVLNSSFSLPSCT